MISMRSASLLLSVSLFLSEADSRANMHAQVSPHRPDVICAYCMRMQALSCKHTSCTSHTISAQSHVCRRALARSHTQNENKLKNKQNKKQTENQVLLDAKFTHARALRIPGLHYMCLRGAATAAGRGASGKKGRIDLL